MFDQFLEQGTLLPFDILHRFRPGDILPKNGDLPLREIPVRLHCRKLRRVELAAAHGASELFIPRVVQACNRLLDLLFASLQVEYPIQRRSLIRPQPPQ